MGAPKFDVEANLEDITSPEAFENLIDEAARGARARAEADPEWTTPRWLTSKMLLGAFALGVIQADMHRPDYQVPDNYIEALNHVARAAEKLSDQNGMLKISLLAADDFFLRMCELPVIVAWNEMKTPFIDLHALARNATIYLRQTLRADDAFDAKFEKEWAEQNGKIQ